MFHTGKPFLDALNRQKTQSVPFWFMRQAGRYLPEYRETRAKAGGFLNMVYDPKTVCEITMQPIRRFGMDAAIIFSDILVVPQALGQKLEFTEGEGPKLDRLENPEDYAKLNFKNFEANLTPVYEAVRNVKSQLHAGGFSTTALIGFCGAPWTLAAYMLEGHGGKDFIRAKSFAYRDPMGFYALIEYLVEASILHLSRQIEAGAEAVQIFDSWAGVLDSQEFAKWVIRPTKEIITGVQTRYPHVPIIGFPRGAGQNYLQYVQETGITAINLDQGVPPKWAARALQPLLPVQGNLDPAYLIAGGDAMIMAAERVIAELSHGPFIFNLGHGVNKETPIEHVDQLVNFIKQHKLVA
jgi:uroporphyrinogen decarboxylase